MQILLKTQLSLLILFAASSCNLAIAQFDEIISAGENSLSAAFDSDPTFLPVNEAFVPSMRWNDQGQTQLVWYIEPGYYLYRDRFAYQNEVGESASASYPPGVKVFDEFYQKDLEVFYNQLASTLEIPDETTTLYIQFQGCAEAGLCYPPNWIGFDIDLDAKAAGFIGPVANGPLEQNLASAESPVQESSEGGLPITLIIGSLAGLILLLVTSLYISKKPV